MTALLDRPVTPPPAAEPPQPRGIQAWGSWRLALRLAARDLTRHKGRALLMVFLVALPVAGVSVAATLGEMKLREDSNLLQAERSLGSADAAVMATWWTTPVQQNVTGTEYRPASADGVARRPGGVPDQVAAAVPPDWSLHRVDAFAGALSNGVLDDLHQGSIEVGDPTDPVVASTLNLMAGRLPTGPHEVAVTGKTLAEMGVSLGDDLQLRMTDVTNRENSTTMSVVGSLRSAGWERGAPIGFVASSGGTESLTPSPANADRDARSSRWLVTSPDGRVPWDQVQSLNRVGFTVTSREVLTNPPADCGADFQICTTQGPADSESGAAGSVSGAGALAGVAVAIAVALAILQVALLAGPAFAVSLRRRQRDLALLAATGASPRDLRRQMLASGVVVGLGGALLGAAVGYGAAWAVFFVPRLGLFEAPAVPPMWWAVLLPAIFAVLCAVAAAWVPARLAGRTNVAAALAGRPPSTTTPRRAPVLGLVAIAVALVLAWIGLTTNAGSGDSTQDEWAFVAVLVAVLLGQLGVVACIPALVAGMARFGRWLPLTARLTLRDLSRHRIRTAAAVAAVSAITLVATGTLIYQASGDAPRHPWLRDFSPKTAVPALVVQGDAEALEAKRPAIRRAAPQAPILESRSVTSTRTGRPLRDAFTGYPIALMSPADLATLIGSDAATAALNAGRMVTFAGNTGITETTIKVRGSGMKPQRIPAAAIPGVPAPMNAVVGPAFDLSALQATPGPPAALFVLTDGVPSNQTRAVKSLLRQSTRLWWDAGATARGDLAEDATAVIYRLLVITAVTMAILTALMVTGLALLDARRDMITAAQVGAPPRFRRGFAFSAAAIVTSLGISLGVLTTLVAVTLGVRASSGQTIAIQWPWGLQWLSGDPLADPYGPLVIPALALLVLVLGPTLIAGTVAWLATRSRPELTRATAR